MNNAIVAGAAPVVAAAAEAGQAGSTAGSTQATQYLTFTLAGETYAIGILGIKEIIEYRELTEVPMMPACLRGVINLRGAVVPVVDPLARFGKPSSAVGKRSCIVIVEVQQDERHQIVGVVVDAVSEVLDIPGSDMEPAPSFGARVRSEFIAGMGKVRGKFVIVLDADRMLALDDMASLSAVPADAVN
jgi:purine-binding chemotaxis protein CheW